MKRFLFALPVLLVPNYACAYIDPGSGMLLWQGLIAAVGALFMVVRSPLRYVRRLVSKAGPESQHDVFSRKKTRLVEEKNSTD